MLQPQVQAPKLKDNILEQWAAEFTAWHTTAFGFARPEHPETLARAEKKPSTFSNSHTRPALGIDTRIQCAILCKMTSSESAGSKPANGAPRSRLLSPNTWLRKLGVELKRTGPQPGWYDEDSLKTTHNHDFLQNTKFLDAYARGVKATGKDYQWRWRVHVGLWVAETAGRLQGDFIECGVNRGFLSSAIMHHLRWNTLSRTFYLLDTFKGIDERYITEEERAKGTLERNQMFLDSQFYVTNVDSVRKNFSEWKNVQIVQGSIPETLSQVKTKQISYLHLDMNCSPPEVAAAEYFWPSLVPGGLILLDDYAYHGYQLSKEGMDHFAASKNITVLSLPTGQGLMIKP
jgi:hypothetical protein